MCNIYHRRYIWLWIIMHCLTVCWRAGSSRFRLREGERQGEQVWTVRSGEYCESVILLFCYSVILLFCYSVILLSLFSLPLLYDWGVCMWWCVGVWVIVSVSSCVICLYVVICLSLILLCLCLRGSEKILLCVSELGCVWGVGWVLWVSCCIWDM
jgi:hypothetical protein